MNQDHGAPHVGADKRNCPNLILYYGRIACCCLTPAQEAELDALLAKAKQ